MFDKWETQQERLKRFMKIPPRKKMEWLQQMNEFTLKTSSKRTMAIRRKLREKIRKQI